MVLDAEGIGEIVVSHFSKLNKRHVQVKGDLGRLREGVVREDRAIMGEEISGGKMLEAIKGLKVGKAVGGDNIPNEFIREGGLVMVESLRVIFNSILAGDAIPKRWKISRTTLLHKGGVRE